MNAEVEMYLEITDRVSLLFDSLDLDYQRLRNSLKVVARQIGKEFSSIINIVGPAGITSAILANAVRACYMTTYECILSETPNHTNIVEAVNEFPFESFPKMDIFIFSKSTPEKITAYVVVDVYPNRIGYVPLLEIRKTPVFVPYDKLSMQ